MEPNPSEVSHQTKIREAPPNKTLTFDYLEATTDLINLLIKFHDVIALSGDPLGVTSVLEHHIPLLPDASPVYMPSYQHPKSHRAIIENLVQDMLSNDIIESIVSP